MYKHIAKSGKNEGKWVDCPAVLKCRNKGFHVPAEEIKDATKYYNWQLPAGQPKYKVGTLPAKLVFDFINLSDEKKAAYQAHEDLQFVNKHGTSALDTLDTTKLVPKERWNLAKRLLRREGINFRDNVQKCCRSCITPEDLGLKTGNEPYAYTYGGQGNRISWDEHGNPVIKVSRRGWRDEIMPYGDIYINHDNGAAPKVVDMLKRVGLNASWDGSKYSAIIIKTD